MNVEEIHAELKEKRSDLIDRHRKLKAKANRGVNEYSPTTQEGVEGERDGVLRGISAIEDVLNKIEKSDD